MNIPKIANAMGCLDEDLIVATQHKRQNRTIWLTFGSVAACFAVIATVLLLPLFGRNEIKPSGDSGRYKPYNCISQNSAIVWKWEFCPIFEQYTQLELNGISYHVHSSRAVSADAIGEKIGIYSLRGYDEISRQEHAADFEVYELRNLKAEQFVAVKMADAYYVCARDGYHPPDTWGQLLSDVDLTTMVALTRFSENGDGPEDAHFTLQDDNEIWRILSTCTEAPFVEDSNWFVHERQYVSFSVTVPQMGVYKNVLYITQDGYLWTNLFSYGYLFDIGQEAAGQILAYAKAKATKTTYEPYTTAIVGTVTEVTDEYFILDDSVLCKDENKGIAYKVLLNDIRVSRYFTNDLIRAGVTVSVTYEGEIDKANGYAVDTAYQISKVRLYFQSAETTIDSESDKTATTRKTETSSAS